MARPIVNWDKGNAVFTAPPGRDDVSDLTVFRNRRFIVSAWDLSPEELEEVRETGIIYLSIMGQGMPPVYVGSESAVREMVADFGVWKR